MNMFARYLECQPVGEKKLQAATLNTSKHRDKLHSPCIVWFPIGNPTKDRGEPVQHEAGGYPFEHLLAQMDVIVSTSSKGFAAEELVG